MISGENDSEEEKQRVVEKSFTFPLKTESRDAGDRVPIPPKGA